MNINLISETMPISVNIKGNFKEIDLHWYIEPLYKALQKRDFEKLNQSIYKFKNWAKEKHYTLKIKAPILFKLAFFIFYKKEEYDNQHI